MNDLISRRALIAAMALAPVVLPATTSTTGAQDASPLADLGFPTIEMTVSETGFEGVPATLEAGRYLVTATATPGQQYDALVDFMRPYGMSGSEFVTLLGALSGTVDASDVSEPVAEALESAAMGMPPAFLHQSTFAGGVLAGPDVPGQVVIDLTAGEWVVWGDDGTATQTPAILTVTGEFPEEAPEPAASLFMDMVDFGIEIRGDLIAGDHILQVDNQGAEPHFLMIARVPPGTTGADFQAYLDSFVTGTPAANLGDADFDTFAYSATQSMGMTTWTEISLSPGRHLVSCWFPAVEDGGPHAFHGMYTLFDVE